MEVIEIDIIKKSNFYMLLKDLFARFNGIVTIYKIGL